MFTICRAVLASVSRALPMAILPPPVGAEGFDLAAAKVVDLTHSIDASTIFWPTEAKTFELTEEHKGVTERGFFLRGEPVLHARARRHTHRCAVSFCREGRAGRRHPRRPSDWRAAVIDISAKAAVDPDYTLTPEDVTAWEAINGTIARGSIVLLRTGWSSRWPDKRAYLGDDTPGDASHLHFPSYGADAARLLVERGAAVLGVDTASVDNGPSKDFFVHRVLGAANVVGLENLMSLDQLPLDGGLGGGAADQAGAWLGRACACRRATP